MKCMIREWKMDDAAKLAEMLDNKNILDNLRDGLPYPYTKSDAEEYIKHTLGTSAVTQVCNYIFDNTDIIRIFAEPFAYNVASCRVLEKAGFQFEGLLKNNAIKNGKVIDMKMYSLIKELE